MSTLVVCVAAKQRLISGAVMSMMNLDVGAEQLDYLFLVGGDSDPYPWANLCRKLNHARDVFLAGSWDTMLTVESDNIVPPDTLHKLLGVDADVVYGLYVIRYKQGSWNISLKMGPPPRLKLLSEDPERAKASWGKVIDCEGHGQGVCLIKRNVLHTLKFRTDWPEKYAPDWYLSMDCQRLGFSQKAHLGAVVGHAINESVWWPTKEGNLLLEQKER